MNIRIGTGYDAHKLVAGRKLILCGEEIFFEKGLAGHSDADAAAHAIIDALLGAAALGDIGAWFPDTDPRYKDISSLKLLAKVKDLLKAENYQVGNIDVTIIAQRPKLSGHAAAMRANIAASLDISVNSVNIKATTEEGLGFTGQGQGIAAQACCLIFSV
ncbi:MAG: 2-C-methyl-D-erythritol 2,4-cyclodiphosphate synthase [Clostridiales bacterium]|jgi:2-C-methyl-D-erythritol 2,4-cyclodiphosphate synthase|nr:2-C-methyl-D-erythritol 2,4-cyclodiphosphate synthase [Clostridiales bacterium]